MVKLYEHQRRMVSFSLLYPHCCFLADLGTGKTYPAIHSFCIRYNQKKANKCLIVCPVSVMENWQREINKYTGGKFKSQLIYGNIRERVRNLEKDAHFFIVNYDYLNKIKMELASCCFDFLIADEITYVKHHSTQRSRALRFISKDIPYRIGLTGYPITQSPMDAFGEFLIIHPPLFGTNFYAFRGHYFKNVGRYFPMYVPIEDRIDELANKIASISIFIKKEDCLDLPAVVYEERKVSMPEKMVKDYKDMKDNLILEIKESKTKATAQVILTKIIRLSQITSGFIKDEQGVIRELGYNPKYDELKDLLEGELKGKKVIIWCRFVHTIKMLKRKLKHLRPAVLYGETKNKQEELDKFANDDKCKVFIGQISLGFGFNLTSSDTMIYMEHDFSVEKRQQSLARNNRIGQKANKLTVIDLVVDNSIDEYVLKSIKRKEDVANYIFDILEVSSKEFLL